MKANNASMTSHAATDGEEVGAWNPNWINSNIATYSK